MIYTYKAFMRTIALGIGLLTSSGTLSTYEDVNLQNLTDLLLDTPLTHAPDNLKRLINLVEEDQAFDQATNAAQKEADSPEKWTRISAHQLFQALVRHGQAFEESIQAAHKAAFSSDKTIQMSAMKLFQTLVEQGQAFDQASSAAFKVIRGVQRKPSRTAIEILEYCSEKNPSTLGRWKTKAMITYDIGMRILTFSWALAIAGCSQACDELARGLKHTALKLKDCIKTKLPVCFRPARLTEKAL